MFRNKPLLPELQSAESSNPMTSKENQFDNSFRTTYLGRLEMIDMSEPKDN
jgi:hypothetical protein